jgi:cytochrome c556
MGSRNVLVLVSLAALFGATTGLAQDAEGVIDYRKKVMSAMAGHISAMADIGRGLVPFQDHAGDHAAALKATADMLDGLFPAGSSADDSDALAAIWDDPDGFAAAVAAYKEAADSISVELNDGASTMRAVGALGRTCSGCHDNYRRPSD